jgi:hypothetical protein
MDEDEEKKHAFITAIYSGLEVGFFLTRRGRRRENDVENRG